MDNFNVALRQAIYMIECPLQQIADAAKCGRTTVYAAMHGGAKLRPHTAKMMARAVCEEINSQIDRRQHEIEELKRHAMSVRAAYNRDFGGGADGR